jgi:hypothetical protein
MKTSPKEWGGLAILVVIAAVVMAAVPCLGGCRPGFGRIFLWGIIFLPTLVGTVIATVLFVLRIGKRADWSDEGALSVGWLLGLFVTAPIVGALLSVVFGDLL